MSRPVDIVTELESLADAMKRTTDDLDAHGHIAVGTVWKSAEGMVRERAAELRAAAPAEDWEPVTADQVRVGDHIEVTREWDGGVGTVTGRVCETDSAHNWAVHIEGWGWVEYVRLRTPNERVTIRRRVRQPMAEPDAPAVVRHAGKLFARGDWNLSGDRWLSLGDDGPRGDGWLTWPEVVALDPATDPVVVDLGGAS